MISISDINRETYFMEVSGRNFEGYFDGRLPMPGEAVDLVCIASAPGSVRFALRVREKQTDSPCVT